MAKGLVELGLKRPQQKPAATGGASNVATFARPAADQAADPVASKFSSDLVKTVLASGPEADPALADLGLKLEQSHHRVQDAKTPAERASAIAACVTACQRYLTQADKYYTDRESELTETIAILREAVSQIAGRSSEFTAEVRSSSERFGSLAQLDDIRVLKRQISAEVTSLRKAAEEREKRDADTYAKLSKRVEVLQTSLVKAEKETWTDPLTGVANRRGFDRALKLMTAAARQGQKRLTVAMVDLDEFKQINDQHGHTIGDRVLLCTALKLAENLPATDCVARYGGEEFAMIVADRPLATVELHLTHVLAELAASTHQYEADGQINTVKFTASCGIAEFTGGEPDEDLVRRADAALYEAKRRGKNRVVVKKRSMFEGLKARL